MYNEMEGFDNSLLNCEDAQTCVATNFTITGSNLFCTSETYALNPLPPSTQINWSVSPSGIVNLISNPDKSVTLNKVTDGEITLTATITLCGVNITKQMTIKVGVPVIEFVSFTNDVGGEGYWCSTHYNNIFTVQPNTQANYEVRLLNWPSMTVFRTNNYAVSGTDPFGYVPTGWYIFQVRTTNTCGTSDWYETEIEYVDCLNEGGGENFRIMASPNPTDGDLNVSIEKEKAEVKALSKAEKVTYQLYNFNRSSIVKQWTFDNSENRRQLNVRGLTSGQYILVVTKGKYRQSKQIIVR